jgi:hypothetical protein
VTAVAPSTGFQIGRAFVEVVPSFDNTQRLVNSFVSRMRPIKVPAEVDPKGFGDELKRAAAQAAKGAKIDLGQPQLDVSKLDKQVTAAAKSTKFEVHGTADLDTKLADAKAKELEAKRIALLARVDLNIENARAKLAELESSTPKIGVDLDLHKSEVEAQLAAFEARRVRIQAQIDVDASKAAGELAAIDAEMDHLDGRTAQVNVESSTASRAAGIMALLTAGIAAAGYAAPAAAAAISAIPAAITGAAQGVSALLLAFNGIGTALKAYQAADDETTAKATSNAKARVSAANSIASAQSALASAETNAAHTATTGTEQVASARQAAARAQESLAQAQETALRRVQDAERTLASAQANSRAAQEALNQAREDAKERIEDLKLSLQGAALDEESASIALEKALAKLQALKNAGVGPTTLEYREADLAARQAAQTLDEVRDRYADLQQQSQYAAKTGVEGDKAVIAAHKEANDATARVQDAERSLTQARADGARQVAQAQAQAAQAAVAASQAQEHASWANEAATKAVADAQRNLATATQQAGADGTAAMDKLQLAMSKLSPAGRSFVEFLQKEAKPALSDMGNAVQAALLPKLTVAFRDLLELSPEVTAGLTDTANVIGELALKGSRMMTSGPWRRDFAEIMKTNNQVMYDLGDAGLSITDSFRSLLIAVGPVMRDFAQLAAHGAETFDQFVQGKRATGELTAFMREAGDKLKDVLRFAVDLGKAVFDLATALAPLGGALVEIVDYFAKLISSVTDAHPLLTNIIAGAGLAATALLLFGRAVNGAFGAVKSGIEGYKTLGINLAGLKDRFESTAEGTSRWSGVADAAVRPVGRLRGAVKSLANAYRDGARATREYITTQADAQGARPSAGVGIGQSLARGAIGLAEKVDDVGAAAARASTALATKVSSAAQTMAANVASAATSAASSLTTKLGEAPGKVVQSFASGSIALSEKLDDIGSAAVRASNALGVKLANGIDAARNPSEALRSGMDRLAIGMANGIQSAERMGETVRSRLSTVLTTAGETATGLGTRLKEGFASAASTVSSATEGLGTRIKSGLTNAVSTTHDAIVGGVSRAADAFEGGLVRISGAAGGAANAITKGLGSAVSGIANVFGGPWGLAVTGATLLLTYFINKQQEAAQKAADYKKDVDSLTEAYKQSGGALDSSIVDTNNKALADKNAAANARAAGSSFEVYAAAANGNATALDQVTEASDKALRSIGESAGLTREQTDALVGVGREALNTGKNYDELHNDVLSATATFDDYGTVIAGLTDKQTDQVNSILNGVGAVGEQIKKNKDARDSYLLLEAASSKVTTATIEQWEAQQKLRDVTKELAEASLSLRDAQADLHDAQKNITEAQEEYNKALKNGPDSKEAQDAADRLADAKRSEEHAILSLLDAAQREAEARNNSLPSAEREAKATEARNKALADLVKTYKGPLPDAIKDSIKGMDLASASAAGFTTTIDDFGKAIVKLPDGTEIKIDADDRPARTKIDATVTYANGQKGTVTLYADTDPATGQTQFWQRNADGTIGLANLDAKIDPATGKVQIWQTFANGQTGLTNLDAFTDPADGKVRIWKDAADHTKGWATLDANTQPATDKLTQYGKWAQDYLSHLNLTVTPRAPAPGAPPLPLPGNAIGNLLEFYAGGGFRQKLTGMSAKIARIVPPNTWRVVGDRADGDEAFIPVNDSPRSVDILRETARRMGYLLAPIAQMALGGVTRFAAGAVAAPSAAPAGGQAGGTASPVAAPAGDQLDALTAAMGGSTEAAEALAAALVALQTATSSFTAAALVPLVAQVNGAVNPALDTLMARLPPVQGGFTTTASVVASTTAGMTSATANAVSQISTYLANLRTALQVTGQAFQNTSGWVNTTWSAIRGYTRGPVADTIAGPINAGLVTAWNYLDSSFGLNHHLNPLPIAFAEGGQVRGPGTGTSDSILTRLSNGEYVVPAALTKRILPFLEALRGGQAEALQAAGYASGGLVADTGSQLNAAVARAQSFASAQRGKPYIWGGVGPAGYDCSGLASAITNVLMGKQNPYVRLGVAASEPWPGFVRGLSSAWALGASAVHTAGTLGGINVESTGNHVRFGGDAHGADDPQFRVQSSLPVVGGKFLSGGGANFDPAALVASAFTDTAAMITGLRNKYPGNIAASTGAGEAGYASNALQKIAVDNLSINSVGGGPEVRAAKNFARTALARFGWGQDQFPALEALWNGESGWNYRALNRSSGAYGIPQALPGDKMASQGPDWRTNAATQILWGLGYIKGRPDYGSPSAAYAKWLSRSPHWYDDGGWLPPGYTNVANHTGKPEAILTQDQWNALTSMAGLQRGSGGRNVTVNARTDASPEHIAHVIDRHLAIGSRL